MKKNGKKHNITQSVSNHAEHNEVEAYIAGCPADTQGKLKEIRAAIRKAAPGAAETTSYFQIPGYSYPGYDYNGMFAWFDLRKSVLNLRVRPPVIRDHQKELEGYSTTKSIVRFPLEQKLPVPLVKKLVKASVRTMKEKSKKPASKSRA
jgi:uncharacterized protein YdhG (YjbR/CyaY superfamily)